MNAQVSSFWKGPQLNTRTAESLKEGGDDLNFCGITLNIATDYLIMKLRVTQLLWLCFQSHSIGCPGGLTFACLTAPHNASDDCSTAGV